MLLYSFLITLICTAALIRILKIPALKYGYVDNPFHCLQGRKKHIRAVAPIGGVIAIPVAMAGAGLAGFDWIAHWPLMLAIGISLIMGIIDDIAHLTSIKKMGVQVLVAFILVGPGGAELRVIGDLFGFGPVELGAASLPFSLFCMVLLINAINMIDGLDGLLGGIGLIVLSFISVFIFLGLEGQYFPLLLPLLGALAGFTLMNIRLPHRPYAHVFFGDSGSLALGSIIGWLAVTIYNDPDLSVPSMTIAWLLAFSVMDAFALFTLRLSERRSPFDGDRYHAHHILRDSGFSVAGSVAIIHFIHIVYALIAMLVYYLGPQSETAFFYLWLALLIGHTVLVFKAHWTERKLHDFFSLK